MHTTSRIVLSENHIIIVIVIMRKKNYHVAGEEVQECRQHRHVWRQPMQVLVWLLRHKEHEEHLPDSWGQNEAFVVKEGH